jgi:hypothetical protein
MQDDNLYHEMSDSMLWNLWTMTADSLSDAELDPILNEALSLGYSPESREFSVFCLESAD